MLKLCYGAPRDAMRIRQRLTLTVGIVALLSVLSLLTLWYRAGQEADLNARIHILRSAERSVITMQSLSQEFRLWWLERAAVQWRHQHQALLRALDTLRDLVSSSDPLGTRLLENVTDVAPAFEALVVLDPPSARLSAELVDSRLRQLLKAQVVVQSDLHALVVRAEDALRAHRNLTNWVFFGAFFVLALVVLLVAAIAERSTIKPLLRLRSTAERLGKGDLSVRTGIRSTDEIGELARRIDAMGGNLQKSLASREELSHEVENHTRMERRMAFLLRQFRRSNEELASFAYAASHDLQEPLRVIISYLQLIERRYRDALDDDGREFIDFAVDGAQRMQNLIQDLLAYSRLSTRDHEEVDVDLNDTLARVMRDLNKAVLESRASVSIDPLPTIKGDPTQMQQLFQNLLGNAVKFAHPERAPEIIVAAEAATLHDDIPGWRIDVSDNGIGIDLQYKERVFRVFQRLHCHDVYVGTGIGLAICKKVVERHGGEIDVVNNPTHGVTFSCLLPANHVSETGVHA